MTVTLLLSLPSVAMVLVIPEKILLHVHKIVDVAMVYVTIVIMVKWMPVHPQAAALLAKIVSIVLLTVPQREQTGRLIIMIWRVLAHNVQLSMPMMYVVVTLMKIALKMTTVHTTVKMQSTIPMTVVVRIYVSISRKGTFTFHQVD